jgi:hypothetical protein
VHARVVQYFLVQKLLLALAAKYQSLATRFVRRRFEALHRDGKPEKKKKKKKKKNPHKYTAQLVPKIENPHTGQKMVWGFHLPDPIWDKLSALRQIKSCFFF